MISPQNTIIVEGDCRIKPKMEALFSSNASAAICIYVGLNDVWLPRKNSEKFHVNLVVIVGIISTVGSLQFSVRN